MILTFIISAMLAFPMGEREKKDETLRFKEMVLVEETTLPKPFITEKR